MRNAEMMEGTRQHLPNKVSYWVSNSDEAGEMLNFRRSQLPQFFQPPPFHLPAQPIGATSTRD